MRAWHLSPPRATRVLYVTPAPARRETLRQARADLAALKRREGDARKTLEAKEKRLSDLQVLVTQTT